MKDRSVPKGLLDAQAEGLVILDPEFDARDEIGAV